MSERTGMEGNLADRIEGLCDWVADYKHCRRVYELHRHFHAADTGDQEFRQGICPFHVAAEVLRGNVDPRRVAVRRERG